MDKNEIYDAAFSRWGFDAQMLVLNEEASELAAVISRFLNHRTNIGKVVSEAADVEIMIEQLRHNGFGSEVDNEKERKLARLSRRLGVPANAPAQFIPPPFELIDEALEHMCMAKGLSMSGKANHNRQAAAHLRSAMGRMMYAAQLCIRDAQRQEMAKSEKQPKQ
ncbi:TPA: hypothetical protein G8O65_004081 [Salmonella enterica]|uniref:Uncharacterized protein n=1 Tax=Salmonella enterica TaxID=28901 RepID=A0A761QI77_SALER|nr:hypothetical protein [Salmonella enterica]HDJ1974076.1 hypothetical protein [Salmonella enterica subsp. enterica]HAG5568846.1 hypothetical protein [Salmonella enterica]HAK0560869.1 hypothetical protein [Salmonella enterica]HAK0611013.1 hypothetical protein [Salmonella enterica]